MTLPPSAFLAILLRGSEEWDAEKVKEAMTTGRDQRRVRPKQHFVIDVSYLTAWVDEEGKLIIRNDPYQFDKEQLKILKRYKRM